MKSKHPVEFKRSQSERLLKQHSEEFKTFDDYQEFDDFESQRRT